MAKNNNQAVSSKPKLTRAQKRISVQRGHANNLKKIGIDANQLAKTGTNVKITKTGLKFSKSKAQRLADKSQAQKEVELARIKGATVTGLAAEAGGTIAGTTVGSIGLQQNVNGGMSNNGTLGRKPSIDEDDNSSAGNNSWPNYGG